MAHSQESKSIKTFYLKKADDSFPIYEKRVSSIDSADYIRTISTEKSNENLYSVKEYFLDKSLKKTGNSLTSQLMPKYHGKVLSYYKNGNMYAEENYINGTLNGVSNYYYANKQLKKKINSQLITPYFDKTSIVEQKVNLESVTPKYYEKVVELNDSLGNHFLDINGSGKFKMLADNDEIVEGEYTNGLQDKTWKTINLKNKSTYYVDYKNGEYLQGKTIDSVGNIFTYNKIRSMPGMFSGFEDLKYQFSRSLRYPPEARDRGIEGRVVLSFVVEKDGSLSSLKVHRSIGGGCDEEAIRVLKLFPRWTPAQERGVAKRMQLLLPVNFGLGK
jgi:TonB family protein